MWDFATIYARLLGKEWYPGRDSDPHYLDFKSSASYLLGYPGISRMVRREGFGPSEPIF